MTDEAMTDLAYRTGRDEADCPPVLTVERLAEALLDCAVERPWPRDDESAYIAAADLFASLGGPVLLPDVDFERAVLDVLKGIQRDAAVEYNETGADVSFEPSVVARHLRAQGFRLGPVSGAARPDPAVAVLWAALDEIHLLLLTDADDTGDGVDLAMAVALKALTADTEAAAREHDERVVAAFLADPATEEVLVRLGWSRYNARTALVALAGPAAAADRGCGCTADTELAAGPGCTVCGHRDHGRSGCAAAADRETSE